MKYLFVYKLKCTLSNGTIQVADGSTVIINQSDNRITKDCIFGDNGAVDIVKRGVEETGGTDVTVAPMGWFKFDDEDDEDERLYSKIYFNNEPNEIAEKIYQLCDSREKLIEVWKEIGEYIESESEETTNDAD